MMDMDMDIGLPLENGELRILILEDVLADAILIERQLRASGLEFRARLAQDSEEAEWELDDFAPHLVLSAPWSWREISWGGSKQDRRDALSST